jgi:hypothetical protein
MPKRTYYERTWKDCEATRWERIAKADLIIALRQVFVDVDSAMESINQGNIAETRWALYRKKLS